MMKRNGKRTLQPGNKTWMNGGLLSMTIKNKQPARKYDIERFTLTTRCVSPPGGRRATVSRE